jgi:CTP:molybdopterin cytidylyltransferase MocA
MGGPKALLPQGEATLLAKVLEAWLELGVDALAVVDRRDLTLLVVSLPPAAHLLCADGEEEMIHSARRGLSVAAMLGCARIFLQPVDAGAPPPQVVTALRASLAGRWAVKPVLGDRGGHPLLLAAEALEAMPWRTAPDLRRAVAALPEERRARIAVDDHAVLRNWNRPDQVDPRD